MWVYIVNDLERALYFIMRNGIPLPQIWTATLFTIHFHSLCIRQYFELCVFSIWNEFFHSLHSLSQSYSSSLYSFCLNSMVLTTEKMELKCTSTCIYMSSMNNKRERMKPSLLQQMSISFFAYAWLSIVKSTGYENGQLYDESRFSCDFIKFKFTQILI